MCRTKYHQATDIFVFWSILVVFCKIVLCLMFWFPCAWMKRFAELDFILSSALHWFSFFFALFIFRLYFHPICRALYLSFLWSDCTDYIWNPRSAPAPAGGPAPEGGNQPPPNLTSNRRLQQTQAQVDEVSERERDIIIIIIIINNNKKVVKTLDYWTEGCKFDSQHYQMWCP